MTAFCFNNLVFKEAAYVVKLLRGVIMSKSVKICSDLYEAAKVMATNEGRTTAKQIELWANIGRTLIFNPDIPTSHVVQVITFLAGGALIKGCQYKLDDLLAQLNPEEGCSRGDDEWLNMKPVGKEVW
jgi:hypothetical protein